MLIQIWELCLLSPMLGLSRNVEDQDQVLSALSFLGLSTAKGTSPHSPKRKATSSAGLLTALKKGKD